MNCSTGCTTGPHATFGECMRAKNLKIAYCQSAKGLDASRQKKWDSELASYRSAVEQGIQPDGTYTPQIRQAVEWSNRNGVPYSEDNKRDVDWSNALERAS